MPDNGVSNPTDNDTFEDIIASRFSRRSMLSGGLATAALTFLGTAGTAAAGGNGKAKGQAKGNGPETGAMDFDAVPLSTADEIVVPAGYTAAAFLPWGTPILPGAGSGPYPSNATEQEKRIGLGHDGMWFFPLDKACTRGVLCLNQEYGTNSHVTNGTGVAAGSAEFVALSQAVHGVSVVEIERVGDEWRVVMGSRNRRITPTTPVAFSGPVAGSAQLDNPAGNPFAGTVNNCGNGKTPWGTYLTCEENFNGYFGANGSFAPTAEQARYGLSRSGFGYGWHVHDPRFDLTNPAYANEHKRFGWIVEIDPMNPDRPPVKRTALGRFKHENCEIVEGRGGRIVAYMGDDERFDYIYKFVSADNWKSMRAKGKSPLDEGTLHVARFDADGTGDWVELSMANPTVAAAFDDQADVLINARLAADIVGATKMDRPEWAAADPATGNVFFTLTNNTRRTEANPPNPRVPNPNGHILKIEDSARNTGTTFDWDIFLLAGPASDPTSTTDADSEHGSPDGLSFGADGIMYIQTDGDQPGGTNDQMLLADPGTGVIKRFLTGVRSCEVTGWTPLGDGQMAVNIQHPGDGDPAISSWPGTAGMVPRDACVVITKVG